MSYYDAMQASRLVSRDFLWMVPRTYGDPPVEVPVGFWSGLQTVNSPIIDPDTGATVYRDWEGAGSLVSISEVPGISDLTVSTVTISLAHLWPQVEDAFRGYNLKLARVEIYTGLFDPETRLLVAPAECVLVGYVDEGQLTTPSENEEGGIILTVASDTQELTRANPAKRSDESQRLRSSTDNFYQDTAAIKNRKIFWGADSSGRTRPTQQLQR